MLSGSLSPVCRVKNLYDPSELEPRWQRSWEERALFRAKNPGEPGFDPARRKFYVLDMFPYPSGSGLHVGHAVGYIGTDVVARRKWMEGANVLHPMGWDAFGLPAEQYALQTGKHPRETTAENTANFRAQLRKIGLSYDWARELDTSDPRYFRWTQWLFQRLYEKGLAYQAEVAVWWCEELKTVLANEEVINGRSERGNYPCVKRPLKQWMLRITAYAERLLTDLELLDWPESIKVQQREWIGRSEGAEVEFPIEGLTERLSVFTTRPDTLWGVTFMVVAPEHPLVAKLCTDSDRAGVKAYVKKAGEKSDLERTDLAKEKSGVFTGRYALHPLLDPRSDEARIPIFVADYVLASYGTGAIMAVPGHDERDFEFAKTHNLAIREVVRPLRGQKGLAEGVCFAGEGTALHSGPLEGLATPAAKKKAIELLEAKKLGRARVQYKLRDWLFSRQRYWGEPYPLLHEEDGSITLVPAEDLPVLLPELADFKPAPDGSAPLARAKDWLTVKSPRTGKPARRDTDTMPGWAGSCWYWLRFMDPTSTRAPFAPEAESYWGPVDLYVGGAAHAVMHLLYARFWHKVFFDVGLVSTKEPFQRLFNQGLITAFAFKDSTGRLVPNALVEDKGGKLVRAGTDDPVEQFVTKMAKSLGNVVNPDDVIAEYGADTLRVYMMFMGPLSDSKPWNPRDIAGSRRFLDRIWRVFVDEEGEPVRPELRALSSGTPAGDAHKLERALNRMLERTNDAFESFAFNTAIAAMMEFTNEATKLRAALRREQAERFLRALAPFAPHLAEELWTRLDHAESIVKSGWPVVDAAYLVDDEIELVVQINGKLRAKIRAPKDANKDELERLGRKAVDEFLGGKTVKKVVVVPGRLVNFVGD